MILLSFKMIVHKIKKAIFLKIKDSGNKKIYSLARAARSWRDEDFYKLVFGYYEEGIDFSSFVFEHLGEKYPNNIIYDISIDVPKNPSESRRTLAGFFAQLRWILLALNVADQLNAVPVVNWGINSAYYDSEMDNMTRNVFEYYFEPVSDVPYLDIDTCKNVLRYRTGHAQFFMEHASTWKLLYEINQSEIEKLAEIYKKYIRLNKSTDEFIRSSLSKCLCGKKTLGVHVRGTDYNIGFASHPTAVSPNEILKSAIEVFSKGHYEQVFLATDDINALNLFKEKFEEDFVFYSDVIRSDDNLGAHTKHVDRPLHYYKLGLEVLRDVYTLASCEGLICGLSQVSFAAQYIKLAEGERFEEIKIFNNGMNAHDSELAQKEREHLK